MSTFPSSPARLASQQALAGESGAGKGPIEAGARSACLRQALRRCGLSCGKLLASSGTGNGSDGKPGQESKRMHEVVFFDVAYGCSLDCCKISTG
jgi:hypothetical protein